MARNKLKSFAGILHNPRLAFYALHSLVHSRPRVDVTADAIKDLMIEDRVAVRRLVDFGCGLGPLLPIAQENDLLYCGLDNDEEAIQTCRALYGSQAKVAFGMCKDGSVPFSLTSEDVLILNGVAHHLNDRELQNLIQTAAKSVGAIIILDHVKSVVRKHPWSWFQTLLQKADKGKFVRDYDYFDSFRDLTVHRRRIFMIWFLRLPFWKYFCHTYLPKRHL